MEKHTTRKAVARLSPLLVILPLLGALARPASATEQAREHIIVDGRVQRMPVTPLEPFLDKLGTRPWKTELLSTALWRGYVGTWLLEDDRLSLVSMSREGYVTGPDGKMQRVDKDIPLSLLFGDLPRPIHASWWSGQLVLPQGRVLAFGHRRRDPLHEKTLFLNVKDGRIVSRRLVDNRKEGRGLSTADLEWVTRVATPPPDDGSWHDARTIRTAAFRKAVPSGTVFRTRGQLSAFGATEANFWIPRTPATELLHFKLRDLPAELRETGFYHFELEVTWEREGTETILRTVSGRALAPGETMHHSKFPVPAMPASKLPPAGVELDPSRCIERTRALERRALFGYELALRGPLTKGHGVWTLLGVDVAEVEEIAGETVVAAGLLEKWIVSKALLQKNPRVAKRFGSRGPGIYYRLVHPRTGKLARPQRPK